MLRNSKNAYLFPCYVDLPSRPWFPLGDCQSQNYNTISLQEPKLKYYFLIRSRRVPFIGVPLLMLVSSKYRSLHSTPVGRYVRKNLVGWVQLSGSQVSSTCHSGQRLREEQESLILVAAGSHFFANSMRYVSFRIPTTRDETCYERTAFYPWFHLNSWIACFRWLALLRSGNPTKCSRYILA